MKNKTHYISSVIQQKMEKVGIHNYRQLSKKAKVNELQLYRLQNGLISSISFGILVKIAEALNISVVELIDELTNGSDEKTSTISNSDDRDPDDLSGEQQEAIFILESLILQLPTIVNAVENNPELPAKKLLPLLKPLEQLLQHWGITVIGKVGEIIPFNPQEHELIDTMENDDQDSFSVKVRYVGYRYQEKLLYRAKVCSILD